MFFDSKVVVDAGVEVVTWMTLSEGPVGHCLNWFFFVFECYFVVNGLVKTLGVEIEGSVALALSWTDDPLESI